MNIVTRKLIMFFIFLIIFHIFEYKDNNNKNNIKSTFKMFSNFHMPFMFQTEIEFISQRGIHMKVVSILNYLEHTDFINPVIFSSNLVDFIEFGFIEKVFVKPIIIFYNRLSLV